MLKNKSYDKLDEINDKITDTCIEKHNMENKYSLNYIKEGQKLSEGWAKAFENDRLPNLTQVQIDKMEVAGQYRKLNKTLDMCKKEMEQVEAVIEKLEYHEEVRSRAERLEKNKAKWQGKS
jgi:hypothetical protein